MAPAEWNTQHISEEILAEALRPYKDGLKIATKVGFARTGPNVWVPLGRAEYLRQQTELSLRKLRVDCLDLLQLHRIDPRVDREEQFTVLRDLQKEGKVKALGLSQVSVAELEEAGKYFTVSTVQNRYNLTDRSSEDVLGYAQEKGIGFVPWAPMSAGELARPGGRLAEAAKRLGATTSMTTPMRSLKRRADRSSLHRQRSLIRRGRPEGEGAIVENAAAWSLAGQPSMTQKVASFFARSRRDVLPGAGESRDCDDCCQTVTYCG